MSIPMLDVGPDDIEAALSTYFATLRRSSSTWETGDGTPFTRITHLTGTEDAEVGFADPVVQVDTLVAKSLGWLNARNEARNTHQAMLYLARYQPGITMSGRVFSVDYVEVVESPKWIPFGNPSILRKCGRYQLGIGYVPVPA